MNELTDANDGGSEAEGIVPEASTEVETNSEATTEQATETETSELADDTGEATKRVPWFQKRIDEVTRQKYDAQREADYWRGLAEGRNQQAPVQQQPEGPPDRWEDPDGYDRWLIGQAAQQAREEVANQHKARTYEERENAVRQAHPDYDNVARDPTLPVSQAMAQVIWDSEKGPEILYHLGANRSEAARIAALPPHLQAAALGKIEASLNAQASAPRAQPKAPPPAPPQTVAGLSTGLNKAPEDMTMAEYVAARKAGTV